MLVISFGVMKSASSYQYQILCELLAARHRSFDDYLLHRRHLVGQKFADLYFDPLTDEITDIEKLIPKTEYFTFKTHNTFNNSEFTKGKEPVASEKLMKAISEGDIRIICSLRDPRDILLSAIDHSKRTIKDGTNDFFSTLKNYDDVVPHIKSGFRKAKVWFKTGHTLFIPYEFLFELEEEIILSIQSFVELPFIDINQRISRLKNKKQIHQFNKAEPNRWMNELDKNEQEKFSEIFKNEIEFYERVTSKFEHHFKSFSKYLIKTDERVFVNRLYNYK